MAKTQTLTTGQVAALSGLTVRHVNLLVSEGKGPSRVDGKGYDPQQVGAWLKARIAAEYGITNDGKVYDFDAERARKMKHDADIAEMEAQQLRGDLVKASDVEKQWTSTLAGVRARMLALPSKLAAQTAPPDRLAQVQAVAQRIVHEALTEIADGGGEEQEGEGC